MSENTANFVGLIGPFGVGKTALAHALQRSYNRDRNVSVVLHFADPIKMGLSSMGITKERTPTLYRKTAQFVGAAARAFNPDFWVEQFEFFAERSARGYAYVLVDDVRYHNEIEFLVSKNATIVFVDAGTRINLEDENRDHESEAIANIMHAELTDKHATPGTIDVVARNCSGPPEQFTLNSLATRLERYVPGRPE
jgi:hypothetical protein